MVVSLQSILSQQNNKYLFIITKPTSWYMNRYYKHVPLVVQSILTPGRVRNL